MDDLQSNGHYEEAFALANRITANLPNIKDKLARFQTLTFLSQLLGSAGQDDIAIKYARMMEDALPPGETLCNPRTMQAEALFNSKKLVSSAPILQQAIDTCLAAQQPVFADALWMMMADVLLQEGQAKKAIALLRRTEPGIKVHGLYNRIQDSQNMFARAYWQLADYSNAKISALARVASASPNEISPSLMDAYKVLYQAERKQGDAASGAGVLREVCNPIHERANRHELTGHGLPDGATADPGAKAGDRSVGQTKQRVALAAGAGQESCGNQPTFCCAAVVGARLHRVLAVPDQAVTTSLQSGVPSRRAHWHLQPSALHQ
ncbi:MAG: hypothetical protein ABIT64_06235 [Lysobacteraceae bacterium]